MAAPQLSERDILEFESWLAVGMRMMERLRILVVPLPPGAEPPKDRVGKYRPRSARPKVVPCQTEGCAKKLAVGSRGALPRFCRKCLEVRRPPKPRKARPTTTECRRCHRQVAVAAMGFIPKYCRGGCPPAPRPATTTCRSCRTTLKVPARGHIPRRCPGWRRGKCPSQREARPPAPPKPTRPASVLCRRCGRMVPVPSHGPLPQHCKGKCAPRGAPRYVTKIDHKARSITLSAATTPLRLMAMGPPAPGTWPPLVPPTTGPSLKDRIAAARLEDARIAKALPKAGPLEDPEPVNRRAEAEARIGGMVALARDEASASELVKVLDEPLPEPVDEEETEP